MAHPMHPHLLPFTGYYVLNGNPGDYLLIDTNVITIGGNAVAEASVTIAINGIGPIEYPYGAPNCTFDGTVLRVVENGAEIALVELLKHPITGGISGLLGYVRGVKVTGSTQIGPVDMSVFTTEYYQVTGGHYVGRLKIQPGYAVQFKPDPNGNYVNIPVFTWNYAMFVLAFDYGGTKYTFEMGVVAKLGRVAGSITTGDIWVSTLAPS